MIHCQGCNICITLYRHCIITQSICELPSLCSPPAYHCCQEGEVAVSWVSRRNLTFLAVFDWCPCSSVNDLLQSEVGASAREAGGAISWFGSSWQSEWLYGFIKSCLSVMPTSVTIWKAMVVEGFASLLPSATHLLSTATVGQLLDKKVGRGHSWLWASRIWLEISGTDGRRTAWHIRFKWACVFTLQDKIRDPKETSAQTWAAAILWKIKKST